MGIFPSLKLEDTKFGFFAFEEADLSLAQRLHEYRLRRRMEQARLGLPYYQEREASQIVRAFQQAGAVTTRHTNTPQGLRMSLESGTEIRVTDHRLYFNAPPSSPGEWRAAMAYIKRSRPNQTAYPGGSEIFNAHAYAYATAHGLKVEGYTPPDHMLPLIQKIIHQEAGHLSGTTTIDTPKEGLDAALLAAASAGDAARVSSLLQAGANVNARDQSLPSYLHSHALDNAVLSGNLDTIEALLAARPDNGSIELAMHAAARSDRGNAMSILLPHVKQEYVIEKALCIAAQDGNIPVLKAIINHGVNINTTDLECDTPLGKAAINGHLQTMKVLLDAGADVNATPRHLAHFRGQILLKTAAAGQTEAAQMLLDAGVNAGLWYERAVAAATDNGHTETAAVLIAAGVQRGAAAETSIYWAAQGRAALASVTAEREAAVEERAAGRPTRHPGQPRPYGRDR